MKLIPSLRILNTVTTEIKDKFSPVFILNQKAPVFLSIDDQNSGNQIGLVKIVGNEEIFRLESVSLFENNAYLLVASLSGEIGLSMYDSRSWISEYKLTTQPELYKYLEIVRLTVELFDFLNTLVTIKDTIFSYVSEEKIANFNRIKASSLS